MNKEQGGFCRSEYGIHIQQKASTRKGKCLKEVGLLGFEPRKTGPESVVLPLHHSPNEKIAPSMESTSWATRIRTKKNRTRICCVTITP